MTRDEAQKLLDMISIFRNMVVEIADNFENSVKTILIVDEDRVTASECLIVKKHCGDDNFKCLTMKQYLKETHE